MKAVWNNQVVAEADKEDVIFIESNWYFPPASVKHELITPSDMHSHCPWKGDASYYNLSVDGQENEAAAWYYPDPLPTALQTVKRDFTNYIAFWRGVTVTE